MYAGTLNFNKGYADLIKAFSIVAKKHPEWKVVFAGHGEIQEARELAKDLGVDSQCNFLGWISGEQKDAAFRRASILCLASYQEGFPMAVLDAWAYGVPVVSTTAGGLIDIIIEGQNGLLFEAGNVEQLSKTLEIILSDSELRTRIASESRVLAYTTFNIVYLNHQLGELYESLS